MLLAIGLTAISCNRDSDKDSDSGANDLISEYVGKWYYYSGSSTTIAKGTELTISSSGVLTWKTPDGDIFNGTIKALGDDWCDVTYNGKTYRQSEVYTYNNRTCLAFNVNGNTSLSIKDFPFDGVYTKEYVAGVSTPKAVDLGLSVKWADKNLGASKAEDYGDYYAWGETATKSLYTEETSLFMGFYKATLTSMGVLDSRGNLTYKYDVATQKLGTNWRMPTRLEIQELLQGCTLTWTIQNGVAGMKMVSTKNGNSIFLPASGAINIDGLNPTAGEVGYYWTSSECGGKDKAYDLYVDKNCYRYLSDDMRYRRCGLTIRAVTK